MGGRRSSSASAGLGSKGRFEVTLDGDLIYSKKTTGRHAKSGEVVGIVRDRIGPEIYGK